MYRLFSWEHSYFSGKLRAYLRYKDRCQALGDGYEDILATPDLLAGLLLPKSGSTAVPQIEMPDGRWLQDSSEIIDVLEAAHPEAPVIPDQSLPKQRLASYLIELFADEWTVVPAFWQRWFYTEDGHEFSHRRFNAQQWGAVVAPDAAGGERLAEGAAFFENAFGLCDTRENPKGVYAGLVQLGCTEKTERAWQASQHRLLERLETHFEKHDYLLGGRPSLGDFGLLGPLYAHLYRDAVPGFALRTHFPLVCEWVERTNGEGALNARTYGQKLYSIDESGELVGRVANSDGGEWLPDDALPDTLLPVLELFFEEMWPVLKSSAEVLTRFIQSDQHEQGGELPGKTFTATPGFFEHQCDHGALTHAFEIGGVASRRMVVPYQLWMLGRVEVAMAPVLSGEEGRAEIEALLRRLEQDDEILELHRVLAGCRIKKDDAHFYSCPQ